MSRSLEIKICGINDEYCMATALECGVEYIGLVFFKSSPRNVSIDFSKELLKNRNTYSKIVALTVNPDDNLISKIILNIQPDFIQLHGNETPDRCIEIKNQFNIPIIKGIGVKTREDLINSTKKFENCSDILLLDAPSMTLPGGNGSKFNWNILKDYDYKKTWMLAGGLQSNNVQEAIKITNPPAIDISSGVEVEKGIKSPKLIKDFVNICRNI
jgi:phosphoribosylanthranilate isomerase